MPFRPPSHVTTLFWGYAVTIACASCLTLSRPAFADPTSGAADASSTPFAERSHSAPLFVNDIIPLLTRLGCNQGACHGKNDGRNGFKLSLRGYAPEWDIERLTRESRARRINLAVPEQSLLLRKASGDAPHGGGKLTETGSREYELLADWIRAGAPGPTGAEAKVVRLALAPGDQMLRPGDTRQLTVTAHYSDGATRDVTWLTQFFSNDGNVAKITPAGLITAVREGETSVRAHFQGQVAVALMSVPYQQNIDPASFPPPANFIDEHVFKKLQALHIPPSPVADDWTLVRRLYLDLIGVLPTPDEARAFAADPAENKRELLVENLLNRPEFVDYWTLQFADLLQNRRERDHDVRGVKGVRSMHAWLHGQIAANRPWNALARDVLTATGSAAERPEVGYFVVTVGEKQHADQSEVVASVAQAFLGTRIGCAQCHNHPLEKYTQDDYYHFAAYFAPLKLKRQEPRNGPTVLSIEPLKPDAQFGVTQPRTGRFLRPQTLDGTPSPLQPGDDPRTKLADWITDSNNEFFAGAMVNRIWRHFMGVGLVEPVDDLRASNPPSHPELWQALRRDFGAHGADLRRLMRTIVNSRTYQLESATIPGNQADGKFYSHYLARRLPAEVLLDAISAATERPESFAGYPLGVRAVQLPEPGLDSYFLSQFGRSERVTACACERRGEVTIPQLLQLQNGSGLSDKIRHPEGRLARLAKTIAEAKSTAEQSLAEQAAVDELFLAALGRDPSPDERNAVNLSGEDANERDETLRDLFWALLNSKEFAFNH